MSDWLLQKSEVGKNVSDLCSNCKYYLYWNHRSRECKERNKKYRGDACWEESEESKESRIANRSW